MKRTIFERRARLPFRGNLLDVGLWVAFWAGITGLTAILEAQWKGREDM